MKTSFLRKPNALRDNGNGSFYYRYDLQEVERVPFLHGEAASKLNLPTTQWDGKEVLVYAPLSSNKILQAVIVAEYGTDYEQKLINEFNAANMGLYDAETAEKKIAAYRTFLVKRSELKNQVDADCKEFGIK